MHRLVWIGALGMLLLLGCGPGGDSVALPTVSSTAAVVVANGPTADPPTATSTRRPQPTIHWITATPSATVGALSPTGTTTPTVAPPTLTATPAAPTISQPPNTCQTPAGWERYTILPGQFLGALAACVGVSVGELMAANCLVSDLILAGDELALPRACSASPSTDPGTTGEPAAPQVTRAGPTFKPGAPPPSECRGNLTIAPPSGPAGTVVSISSGDFTSGAQANVFFEPYPVPANSPWINVVATVDATGHITAAVPTFNFDPAVIKIKVVLLDGACSVAPFMLTSPPPPVMPPTATPTAEPPTDTPTVVATPTAEPPTDTPPAAATPTAEPSPTDTLPAAATPTSTPALTPGAP